MAPGGISIATLLLVVVALANSPSEDGETPASSTPTESPSPSATAKPSPTTARVPALRGINVSRAKRSCARQGSRWDPSLGSRPSPSAEPCSRKACQPAPP